MRFSAFAPAALCAVWGASLATSSNAVNVRVLVYTGPNVTVQLSPLSSSAGAPQAGRWDIGVSGGALTLGGVSTASAVLSVPPSVEGTVQVAGRTYRGGVILRADKGKVQAINVLDIEQYLRGVVPAEMPPLWPGAAVRAQAIIARSYAAQRINPAAAYDVCATTQCQVYEGVSKEHPAADAAIAATRAEVVSSGGQVADTYFSADSGGYTASSLEAWGKDVTYLRAQPDPASPGAQKPWTINLSLSQVGAVAQRYGVRVGNMQRLIISKTTPSGRVSELTFTGSNGNKVVAGAYAGELVRALGGKSSRVNMTQSNGVLTLTGTGSGHGVGLSQWGARSMAQAGASELDVLNFYYPSASISLLSAQRPQRSGDLALASRPEEQTREVSMQLAHTLPLAQAAREGVGNTALGACAPTPLAPSPLLAQPWAALPSRSGLLL